MPGSDGCEHVFPCRPFPGDDKLVIEARLDPGDIDVVRKGLPAQVRLTAYSRRTTPTLEGKVVKVSADILRDSESGETYYAIDIEILPGELERVEGIELYPGMPADVMIVTGERTAWEYMFAPIAASFHNAFREP